jgi:NTP pyrophosphatase (non-canonical NTP hydrolase)
MDISEFQKTIRDTYLEKDRRRGLPGTFVWFYEEAGELAKALRKGTREEVLHEFSDVFAWLVSLANIADVELEEVVERYASGCPRCGKVPCSCPERGMSGRD